MGNTISRPPSYTPATRTTGTTQANPAASSKAAREMGDAAAQLKALAAQPAAEQKTSTATQASGNEAVAKLKDEFLGNMDLSQSANDRAIANAQKRVNEFVKNHPNASEEEISAEARKALGNTSTSEYIFKSIIDKSMNDIMAKVQERIDEQK